MTILSTLASAAISLLERFTTKTTVIATVVGVSVTAGELEASAGSLAAFYTDLVAAIKAKNYVAATELSVQEAVVVAADFNAPGAALAEQALPFAFSVINNGLIPYVAALVPVNGGAGGFVTKAWAADPREQLNPDGSFKIP